MTAVAGAHAGDVFEPIPEAEKPLYHFDLARWFYADEAARQADLARLKAATPEILALETAVRSDPKALLRAIELAQQMGIVADRLQAFGGLRRAVNTEDTTAQKEAQEGEDARSEFEATTAFVENTVQGLTDEELQRFVDREPGLASWRYLLSRWRRQRPHTPPAPADAVLRKLSPRLDPFRAPFYTLMVGRSPDATIEVDGRIVNVTRPGDYDDLLRSGDRALRERGFHQRLATYKAQADLFAFALFEKARTANDVATVLRFGDAMDASLFDAFLPPEAVDATLRAFRDNAGLAIRFQRAERAYQAKLLSLPTAEPWDVEARPPTAPEPRFTIGDASRAVVDCTTVFGPDYSREVKELLDPRNGRLDIVAGPNRQAGDFTWGSYGPSWVFYMQGYNGRLADAVMLAHESAHAVHFRLLHAAGVPWHYGDGPRYFTEGFAKVNELLVLDQLSRTAQTNAGRVFFMRELVGKLASVKFASMYWAAWATNFELEVYRGVRAGTITRPDGIHAVWAEFGRTWMYDFARFPDLQYAWAGTHHFFDASRYYSNYLFAWVFALGVYEHLASDPRAGAQLVGLMQTGFSDEPATLLRHHLGIDLTDPAALHRIFALVERKVAEFEQQVAAM